MTCEERDEATTANHTLSSLNRTISKVYPGHLNATEVTVWYNNEVSEQIVSVCLFMTACLLFQPLHMSAAALNAFQNLRLKEVTGNNSLSLQVFNHPLPRRDLSKVNIEKLTQFRNHSCIYKILGGSNTI